MLHDFRMNFSALFIDSISMACDGDHEKSIRRYTVMSLCQKSALGY